MKKMLSLFPLDVLDEIWDLIESVSEGFLSYSFIPWEGDTQLFKQAPGCMVDVDAVQAGKKGLLRLEVVLK